MAQQTINLGTVANDGTGDDLRTGGDKINDNFTELYATVSGAWRLKGNTDCSTNPNYPAAVTGDAYVVTVAGKIGGASGVSVDVGDVYVAKADNAGGTQASVGSSWFVIEHNLTGALAAIAALTPAADKLAFFSGSTTAALTDLTSFMRTALAAADARAAALALSTGYVVAQSAVASPVTGTVTETTLATITIPANAIGPNGQVEIDFLFSGTSSANTKTYRVKFGGTTVFQTAPTTNSSIRAAVNVSNRNAANSQVAFPTGSTSGFGASSSSPITPAIDTTSAVNITITAELGNSGETATLERYLVRVIPKA